MTVRLFLKLCLALLCASTWASLVACETTDKLSSSLGDAGRTIQDAATKVTDTASQTVKSATSLLPSAGSSQRPHKVEPLPPLEPPTLTAYQGSLLTVAINGEEPQPAPEHPWFGNTLQLTTSALPLDISIHATDALGVVCSIRLVANPCLDDGSIDIIQGWQTTLTPVLGISQTVTSWFRLAEGQPASQPSLAPGRYLLTIEVTGSTDWDTQRIWVTLE